MESTWANIFLYGAEVIQKIVPSAKIGYEGSDTYINSGCAADFYKLMKAMSMNNLYDGAFVPYAVMSFARPGRFWDWVGTAHTTAHASQSSSVT